MIPVTSRQLVEEFVSSDLTEGRVDVTNIGRETISIYQALHAFLKRNPEYNIRVHMYHGEVILVKNNGEQGAVIRIY